MADGAPAPGPAGGFDAEKLKGQLGTPGLIAVGSAAVGVVSCMLPWWSSSGATIFGGAVSTTTSGFAIWHGNMACLAAAAAAAGAIMIAMGKAGPNEKNFCFGVMGLGGLVAALALLFILTFSGQSVDLGKIGNVSSGKSIGVYLTVIAGGGIAYGGFLITRAKGHLGK
ncbi:MAG: hypothetical protein AAB434_12760 [Planctomycetota bacterium]